MAVFLPSAIVNDVRGTVGGVTFQNQRGSAVITQKQRRLRSTSTRQLEQRRLAATRTREWSSLSDSEKLQWAQLAQSTPAGKDAFGRQRYLPAYQFFLWQRMYLTAGPSPPLTVPKFAVPGNYLFTPTITTPAAGPWDVTTNTDAGSSGYFGPMFCQRPMSDQVPKVWPPAKMLRNDVWLDTVIVDIYDDFVRNFGTPITGEQLRFTTFAIMNNNWLRTPTQVVIQAVT